MMLFINTDLDVWHRGDHALPEREQVMDRVGRELPHLQALHRELGHQLDGLGVVVHHDELTQLVVGLQPGQETANSNKILSHSKNSISSANPEIQGGASGWIFGMD